MTIVRYKWLATALLLAFTAFPASATEITGGTAEDREQMAAVAATWVETYLSGDLDGFMGIMHDEAIVMPHNVATITGFDAVREYFATRVGNPGVSMEDNLEEIRINGTWAIVRGHFKVTINTGDPENPFVHHGRYLVVYEKTADGWKMFRDMDNANPVSQ